MSHTIKGVPATLIHHTDRAYDDQLAVIQHFKRSVYIGC